ncbi:MAG: YlmH/Sll1252 family protein, partial [Oscillospiraceae bacterium]
MRGFIPPQTQDETVFCKRVVALCEKAEKLGIKTFSTFLDLRQKDLFTSQFNKFQNLSLEFYSGHEADGERCIACVYPSYETVQAYDYPLSVLYSKIYGEDNLTHRDFLGALMNLMIKRDFIGDILVSNDDVYIICHNNMAQLIMQDLTQVAHSNVKLEYYYDKVTYARLPQAEKNVTVASLRLDGV